jgi:hypothetical protein
MHGSWFQIVPKSDDAPKSDESIFNFASISVFGYSGPKDRVDEWTEIQNTQPSTGIVFFEECCM